MSKPELFLNYQITEAITYYNEFSIPRPLQMCRSPSTVEQGRNTRFSVCCSPKETHKNCWGCTQKMSFRPKALSQKLLGRMTDRLTKGCMFLLLQNEHEMLIALHGTSVLPQVHPCYFSGVQEYNLLAGILVLSLKILILRIHVYIGLLILYCNIRWAADTSRGWAIYF